MRLRPLTFDEAVPADAGRADAPTHLRAFPAFARARAVADLRAAPGAATEAHADARPSDDRRQALPRRGGPAPSSPLLPPYPWQAFVTPCPSHRRVRRRFSIEPGLSSTPGRGRPHPRILLCTFSRFRFPASSPIACPPLPLLFPLHHTFSTTHPRQRTEPCDTTCI